MSFAYNTGGTLQSLLPKGGRNIEPAVAMSPNVVCVTKASVAEWLPMV